jgi:short-subunit dehydrogenase
MRDPRHILITGASSGIGAALATGYAMPGIHLSLQGRKQDRLLRIADLARERGAVVTTFIGDVTDKGAMADWIASCEQMAAIDLVIANAGISGGSAKGESADQVQAIFATNVSGVFNTIQPVLPLMKKRKAGQIAIMSSLASFRGFSGAPAYCASKAAIRIYGEGLRAEMRHHEVGVNVICPGFIKTPMTDVNPFAMPLLMTAERAARIIREGLAKDRARIAFPWLLYALVRLLSALPQPLMDCLAARMPKK